MGLFTLGGFFSEAVAETWYSIWLSLNDLVYSLIAVLYQLFEAVANVSLFSDTVFEKITNRIYIVMGVAMLFIFAYNLVLMIINPEDKKGSGQMGKVVKETIISLVLIVLLPTIFKYMNIFQYHVLNTNVIGTIILGDTSAEADCDFSDMELLDEYIGDEKKKVSFGSYCLKGGVAGTAVGAGVGSIATPIGTGVGAVGGAVIGCAGGLIVGGIEKIAKIFGYDDNQAVTNLSTGCQLYSILPDSERGARAIAPTIFSAFYRPKMFGYVDCYNYLKTCGSDKDCNYTFDENNTNTDDEKNGVIDTEKEKKLCAFYVYDVNMAKYSGDMSVFNADSDFYSEVKTSSDLFEFNYLLAFAAGVLALYMFACYTIAIGKRVAKLGFLQIISPITVMMRIIPKQKEAIYDKWQKELINTYLDVFIRLVIIYFALFAISLVPDVINSLFATTGSGIVGGLASVVVILGILQFGQEAPELFKQLFGGVGGKFSLKSPRKQIADNKLAMRGINAFRGGVYGATTGKGKHGGVLGGFISGAGRGAVGGYEKAVKGIDTARTEYENGSRWYGRAIDRVRTGVGMETRADSEDRITNKLNEKIKVNNEDEKKLKEIKNKATDTIKKDTSKVKFTKFSFDGVDFSNMKYVQVKEYEEVLKSNYESATDEASKKAAYQKLINFQNEFGKEMKKKVNEGVTALINGTDFYDDFKGADYAMAKSNISDVLANEHEYNGKRIDSVNDAKELNDAIDLLGDHNREMSDKMPTANVHTRYGYQARHADSRMVKGNGKAEKK